MNWKDLVWVVLDLDKSGKIHSAYENVQLALSQAAKIVGNMSYSGPLGDIYLFGRGDGRTEVIVRQMPRQTVLNDKVQIL